MQKENCVIAVFGLFGSSNLGNEATLAAFLQNLRLRAPDVRILTITPRPFGVDQTSGPLWLDIDPLPVHQFFWRIKPEWLHRLIVSAATAISEPLRRRRAVHLLAGVRSLFVPGTGVVDDFGQGIVDIPLHLDRWTSAATAAGARVVFCSIGVSAVKSPLSRRLFLRSLRRSAYCSVRDETSRENARALGYETASMVPDLAFGLRQEESRRREVMWPPRTIGVGVMGYAGWNRDRDSGERVYLQYIAKIEQLVSLLVTQGYTVRLLVGDTAADTRASLDVSETLTASRVQPGVVIASPIVTYQALIDEIELCDMVAATRYHNVLFSLLAGRPTLSIGYSDKNDALMKSMNQAANCHGIESFDVGAVFSQMTRIAAEPESSGIDLRKCASWMRDRVFEQFDELFAALTTGCGRSSHSDR